MPWRSAPASILFEVFCGRRVRWSDSSCILTPLPPRREALTGIVQLVFFRGGYVGACLVEDGILSVAWVMQARLVRTVGADWEGQCAFLEPSRASLAPNRRARPLFVKPVATAAIPYGFLATRPLPPKVFAIGDQLAVVPSFTGDGMAIALYSGLAAARALMVGQSASLPARANSETAAAVPSRRYIGRLLETPATCGIGIAASRLMPSLVRGVVSATRIRGFDDLVCSLGIVDRSRAAFGVRTRPDRRSKLKHNEVGRKAGTKGSKQMCSAGGSGQRAL